LPRLKKMEHTNLFQDICTNSGFLIDIFEDNNLGIFTDRMTGKSYLSAYIILKYISDRFSDIPLTVYSLNHETITTHHMNEIGYYHNKNVKNNIVYNSKILKNFSSINDLVASLSGGPKVDIVYIDEIFYWRLNDNEMRTLFGILNSKGTKIIMNSTIPGWDKKDYIHKLRQFTDFVLIEDKVINNLRGYNINLKLKNIVKRINGQKDCSHIYR